ncbi:hypothetical protein GH714_007321 [Hevea brasiliensis]|uniref:Integrase catalytic domain-containing protein n=1 Tax=Hevea brasiliensis TaxID=3981 RepID=A0A6A6M960_HEVBR|nr:hypothetical protein GH714_007321 [Hevea brasiliensis]
MDQGINEKLHQIEKAISKFSEMTLSTKEGTSSVGDDSQSRSNKEESKEGGQPIFASKLAKIEFPKFSGDDPTEWMAKVEQFFDYQKTIPTEKVYLASYHLQGEANQWWRWMQRTEFERLGNKVKGWTQKALVGTFMGGLKTEISDGIRMFKPKTLKEAIDYARMRDEQLLRQRKATRPPYQLSSSSPVKSKPTTPVKRLTWEEMQKRRADGLCFNCDEKFVPGTGWSSAGTMRVAIQINSIELIALIDSGSTHNFINEKIAEILKLPGKPTKPFNVKVADGTPLICDSKFRNIPFSLQGIPFVATFFSLPIMGLDVVLGVQWLQRLGTVACNWKDLTMDFKWEGQQRHLQGLRTQPLTNLLKKGNFFWTAEADASFLTLKQALTTTPTLAMPNFDEPFVITTDASNTGIGAVLTQQDRPIAFMSRALGISKQTWSTYAKEMLAILQAVRTWRPYLLGHKFFIHTDQRSLKYMVEAGYHSRTAELGFEAFGYDYEIVYKPGKENKVADALSRVQGSPSLNALFMPHASLWDRLKSLASTDPYMIDLDKKATAKPGQPYSWKSGLLFYKNRVDRQQFYWPSMRTQIQNYIAACTVCQKNKAANSSPAGLLQPLPIPHQVWDDIAMDFIDGLPSSGGKDSILVVIDRLSKYAHFLALSHPYSAKVIAEKFVDGIVKYHGMPRSIISDRDPIFMSHFWREFFKLSGTKLNMSSSYHPQTDGQSEVTNRCLEQYLRCFTSQQPRKWSNFLSWAEYWQYLFPHLYWNDSLFRLVWQGPSDDSPL